MKKKNKKEIYRKLNFEQKWKIKRENENNKHKTKQYNRIANFQWTQQIERKRQKIMVFDGKIKISKLAEQKKRKERRTQKRTKKSRISRRQRPYNLGGFSTSFDQRLVMDNHRFHLNIRTLSSSQPSINLVFDPYPTQSGPRRRGSQLPALDLLISFN